ncbi:trypsin-like peptidase domain-containing protein [Spirochaetia bacterium 38H-sp]|uniref:Trypsin-like peptidase domain-containing protein n=1 Tax=Rarispira pelagica TaxID=3141764 RepID=A0ABU9UCH0_9SPIR
MRGIYISARTLIVIAIVVLFSISTVIGIRVGKGISQTGSKTQAEDKTIISIPPSETNVTPVAENSGRYSQDELENISIYEQRNEAVVNITTETVGYNWFLEPVPQEGVTGSGSIIDKRGYVLTNYHVIKDAYKIYISLADHSQYEGKIVGVDPENDLAVLKFDAGEKELATIPMGESSDLKVGQKVLAIGNPFGLERTLTVGVVSALGRPVKTDSGLIIQGMIQTDTSINPGNSGGPLLDSRGRMIGINTMIYSPSGGSVGVGFAVPVDTARRIVPELITKGHVERGWIDIVPVQLFPSLVKYANLTVNRGILVSKVERGSYAEKAGIRGGSQDNAVRYGRSIIYLGGDIIVGIDGQAVATLADMYAALEDNKPGDVVDVIVVRGNKKLTLKVMLSKRPDKFSWD